MSGGDVPKDKGKPYFCNGARTQTHGGRAEKQDALLRKGKRVYSIRNLVFMVWPISIRRGQIQEKDKFAFFELGITKVDSLHNVTQ